MDIKEVIEKMKGYHKGGFDDETAKDKVLYGDIHQECTGIVTSTWASVDVIKEAAEKGANLIISHEALFWNRGDHTDWLTKNHNKTYLDKKKLLDDKGIVVWRDHDYVHSGIPQVDGTFVDGIFYGMFQELGWSEFSFDTDPMFAVIEIPETSVSDLTQEIIKKGNLNGARIYGKKDTCVRRIAIPYHILGAAQDEINYIDEHDIDMILAMEMVDFTLSEYIRDSNMLKKDKCMLSIGHFNLEEFGMKYMVRYIPEALGTDQIPCSFIQSGDMYEYIVS